MGLGLRQQHLAALALDLVCSEMMVEKNGKDMTWQRKSYKGQGINGMKIEWNGLISLIEGYANKIRQGHKSKILMRQCFNSIFAKQIKNEYLQNK